jgi:ABC-type uncharacterized transport system permease subunit
MLVHSLVMANQGFKMQIRIITSNQQLLSPLSPSQQTTASDHLNPHHYRFAPFHLLIILIFSCSSSPLRHHLASTKMLRTPIVLDLDTNC